MTFPQEKVTITIQTPKKIFAHAYMTPNLTNALYTLAKQDPEVKAAILAVSEQFLMDEFGKPLKQN